MTLPSTPIHFDQKSMKTKRERNFKKLKGKFENGCLSEKEIERIPQNRQEEYLKKELSKLYKKDVRFSCVRCAKVALYKQGCITDDELIVDTNLRHR